MLVGTPWAEKIEAELRRADFLIVFLSERAVHSEMVELEIATPYRLAKEQGGHPLILPVRLDYREPFQFDLALVTATEPYHLIANLNQSPFNVGEVLLLDDFTPEQVADLNYRHGLSLTQLQASQLMALLHGHPYLVRRSLYLVASQQISVEELFAQAISDRGPFGDHLRYHLFRIYEKKDLVQGFLQAICNNTCPDERIARLLSAAGLVRREGQIIIPRCQLYANYFREHLHG